jgi:diacylglycerol kinase
MYQSFANWLRRHRRSVLLLLILLAILLNISNINQAMEGMINGFSDGYHGQPSRRFGDR